MNVLFCQPSLEYSGSEKSLLEIVEGLRTYSEHVPYLLASDTGPMAERFESVVERMWQVNATKLSRNPAKVLPHLRSYGKVYAAMKEIAADAKIDAVYVNTLIFPQAAVAARRLGIPAVVHVREVESTYPHWYYRGLVVLATQMARRIICVCDYIRRQTSMPRVFVDKSVVIENSSGFEVGPIERSMSDGIRVLAITPMDHRKGVDDLVPFVQAVIDRMGSPDIRLRVLGRIMDAPLYKEIVAQAAAAGLSESIEFIDGTDNPAKLYEEANVLIHPSRSEAFPRVLVEAANFSLPAIATDVGGSPEAVADKQTGYIVHVGDVEAMAERVERLARDRALYNRISKAAYARYKQRFTRERMIGKVVEVLESL